jgi:hypothetical protein
MQSIPREWLGSAVSVEWAEEDNTREDGVPFGYLNGEWERLKAMMLPGDELWGFCSPPDSWQHLAGRAGYALIRNGEVIDCIVTLEN